MNDELNRQTADTGAAVPENQMARTPTTGTQASYKQRTGSDYTTFAPDLDQTNHRPPTRLYLAGKISYRDWRHLLVDTRNANLGEEINMDCWLKGLRYVGPYFIGCDHGCAHGTASHGSGENCMNYGDWNSDIRDRCLNAIQQCDMVFAWINSFDCYGTLVELGYAKALGKYIAVSFPRAFHWSIPTVDPGRKPHNKDVRHDFWFVESIADTILIAESPAIAFDDALNRFCRSRWGAQ